MTKGDLFKIVLAALLAGFIRPIIEAFLPTKEKIRVYFIKALNIFFGYLVPCGFLIDEFFLDKAPLDKFFLFRVLLFSIILVVNINLAIFLKIKSDIDSTRFFLSQQIIDTLKDLIVLNENLSSVHVTNLDHLDITKSTMKIAEIDKKLNDEKFATLEKTLKKLESQKGIKKI
jgi:hypothetical protein